MDCPEEIFDPMIEVDVKAVWLGIKLAAPYLIARGGGSIISTASMAALNGIPGLGAYSAARAWRGWTYPDGRHRTRIEQCPRQLQPPRGIATPIPTTYFGPDFDPDAMRPILAAGQPIPRAGEAAADIAGTALRLASDDSSFARSSPSMGAPRPEAFRPASSNDGTPDVSFTSKSCAKPFRAVSS